MKHYTHLHNKEDWKFLKKIDTFSLTTKCSPSCTPWMLALKGTGNICTPPPPAFSVNPLPEIQSCFPWPTVDEDESEPGGRGTKRTSYGEQKHGLMSLIYCLTWKGQSWGRTGRVHFVSKTSPLSTTEQPHNLCPSPTPPPSLFPSWHTNTAFWISVDQKKKYSQ